MNDWKLQPLDIIDMMINILNVKLTEIATMRPFPQSRKTKTHERIIAMVAAMMEEVGMRFGGPDSRCAAGGATGATVGCGASDDTVPSLACATAEWQGTQRAEPRRIKKLIDLLLRQSTERGYLEGAHAPTMAFALSGALALARVVEDPKLAGTLRQAALSHLTPDGA